MGEHFGESFGALGQSIEAMVGANKEYRESMGGVVQHLQAGMDTQKEAAAAMGGTVSEARSAVAEMAGVLDNLRATVTALDSTAGGAKDMLQAQTEQTEQVLVALARQKDVWGEQQESLHSLKDAVDGLRDWHDRVKVELAAQLDSWRESLQVQTGLTDDVRREREGTAALVESLQKSASTFTAVSSLLGQASSSLQGHLETTGSTNQAAAEELVRASAGLGELRAALEGSITAFRGTAEALATSGPQVASALQGLQQAVQGQAQVVEQGQKLAAAMSLSVGRQERLADAFGAAAEMTERVKPAAAQLGQAAVNLEQSTRTLAASLQAMKSVASQLDSRDREASQTWGRVTNEMQATTTALTDGMGAYSKQMNDVIRRTLSEFDREMARATKELQAAVTSLHTIVADLADFTEGMQS
jgi:ABC-type transporter Mla subunit MlaD